MKTRNFKMDNIRFFLIFCVLLGHCLELFHAGILYRVIYTFHMPAFVFLTGSYVRYSPRKIASFFWTYGVFQVLYLTFDAFILADAETVKIQFTTPYWLLWYLLAVIIYYLLTPMLSAGHWIVQVIIATCISLLAGFDSSIGYYLSLSRILVFLPFFVLGYGVANSEKVQKFITGNEHKYREMRMYIGIISALFVVISVLCICKSTKITSQTLYGSYSYEAASFGPHIRLLQMFFAIGWIAFLVIIMPNVKIPLISTLGANTLSIFLMHGFVIRLAGKHKIFHYTYEKNLIFAIVLSLMVMVIFGNKWIAKLFHLIFSGKWCSLLKR